MPNLRGSSVVLKNGRLMPQIGLGCWNAAQNDVAKAVETALDIGYRHIDTATVYFNEEGVGQGINNWLAKTSKKRDEIFLVTKLPISGMSTNGVERYLKASLRKLEQEYVDLYLIHIPVGIKTYTDVDAQPIVNKDTWDYGTDLIAIWKEMERMVDLGYAKSIGVSNFSVRQMRKIDAISRIPMVTNQIEMHLYYQRKEHLEYCEKNNIAVTAFSPLGSPGRGSAAKDQGEAPPVLQDPVVKLVAQKHGISPAQVLIKFLMQLGAIVIPKSVNPARIQENFEAPNFKLDQTDMDALKSRDKGKDGRGFNQAFDGIKNHPECPDDFM